MRCRDHLIAFRQCQAHDLISHDVLACGERFDRQVGMGVTWGRNHHYVNFRVVECFIIAGKRTAVLL